jgi:hypothetical protein
MSDTFKYIYIERENEIIVLANEAILALFGVKKTFIIF